MTHPMQSNTLVLHSSQMSVLYTEELKINMNRIYFKILTL